MSARIKPGPSACQFDELTTTLHAPFSRNEVLSVGTNEMVCNLRKCLILVANYTEFIFLFSFTWRIALFDDLTMSPQAFHLCVCK